MADFNSKYTGEQVEALLDRIANGEISGGSSVYKWNWNSEMYGTFTEEEFENLSNADVVYITTSVDGIEVLYSVDGKVVVEDALHLGAHILSFEIDPDNNNVTYVEGINFIFDNTSKTWNAQGGNTELITNEQLTKALEGKQDKVTLAKVATSGSYNDLSNKPTIPAAVTESTVSGWGFTKNTGTYSKPSGGIPASDLAPDVFLQGEKGEKGDKGDKGDTGAAGTNGKDGADGATFTPSVDANGNLSWTNNKGLTNPPTVNIKGPKGDSGEGGGTSSDGRKEVIYCDSFDGHNTVIVSMKPNVVYWCAGVENLIIESFKDPTMGMDTYDIFTAIIQLSSSFNDPLSLTLPDYVMWANGVIPEITPAYHELSISRISDGDYSDYLAVLTPFKSV